VLLLVTACGDNHLPADPVFTGLSGSRIKLQWTLYQDGTKQLEPASYYDAKLHVRCERLDWIDGVARCSPIADPTVWTDAECTIELGRDRSVRTPKYFIGHDRVDGELRAARLLNPGKRLETEFPTTFFEKRDGVCTQIPEPLETIYYFDLPGELAVSSLAEVWPEEMTDERLSLRVLKSAEGLAAPLGFRDNALGFDCEPEALPDGTSACVPSNAIASAHFADPFCEQPVVVATKPPVAVSLGDANGCPVYRATGAEHAGFVYKREGTTCYRTFLATGEHAYRADAPLDLAPVERIIEDASDRRLQRIVVSSGHLLALDRRLYDTATRTECKTYGNGELAVCVPTTAIAGVKLYANAQCTREQLIADVPTVQCARSEFAVIDAMSIHAIGEPYTGALYALDAAAICRPRPAVAGTTARALGPAIPPTTFVAGVVYSERSRVNE
jgi:hypothetical protein